MSKENTEKVKTEEGLDTQIPDEYSQFLSEWKTSAVIMSVGVALLIGVVLALRESAHVWQMFF